MNREEAIKHLKQYVRKTYGRQKVLAAKRGISVAAVSKAINELSGWLLDEAGICKQVTYSRKGST